MNLQELRQKYAGLCDQQKVIVDLAVSEERALTEEETASFDGLQKQIDDLADLIAKAEKVQDRGSKLAEPTNDPIYTPNVISGHKDKEKDDAGFANLGEFIHAVRFGDTKGRTASLNQGQGQGGGVEVPEAFRGQFMPRFRDEWSYGTGEEGGFAVPVQFKPEMLMLRPEPSIVRERATVIPPGTPPDSQITMPAFAQGDKGVFGGVEVYWIGEGVAKPETGGALEEVSLTPKEVAAHTVVTDKLLRNWEAANTFISTLLRSAIVSAEDYAFLRGDGNGKPKGVIAGDGVLAVNRAKANEIGYTDTINMFSKLLPDSLSRAIYIANISTLPQLAALEDASGRYIYMGGDATRGVPATLNGIPIKFTGKTPSLGAKGDLILVDLAYYLIKDGSGPFIAASEHVLFRQNKTVIKVFWNVDGQGWVKAPLKLEDKTNKVSPYVVLN